MRALRGVIVVVIAIALPAAVLVAVLQASLEVYNRGDDATALGKLRALAEQGDAGAQSRLAEMYTNGEGIPHDYAEAAKSNRLFLCREAGGLGESQVMRVGVSQNRPAFRL
jgi:TPR repeat protein